MYEKKILKKISNIKVQVKKKTDAKQMGNRIFLLTPWGIRIVDGDDYEDNQEGIQDIDLLGFHCFTLGYALTFINNAMF